MTSIKPNAIARLKGNKLAPNLKGTITFFPWKNGTIVQAEVSNLPPTQIGSEGSPPIGPFGFHIHEGTTCGKITPENDFKIAQGHYNPSNQKHPFHAGDMPPLFANKGYAYMTFYTNRFTPQEVINRTVIIHENPDDFRSQPAGASGNRIACGVITKY